MSVPFDENPYSAMAAWFKTDEGVEVYKSIDKKTKITSDYIIRVVFRHPFFLKILKWQ